MSTESYFFPEMLLEYGYTVAVTTEYQSEYVHRDGHQLQYVNGYDDHVE